MDSSTRDVLEVLRFRPHTSSETMTMTIEGIRIVAVTHPLRGLVLMGSHSTGRAITEFEVDVGRTPDVQSVAKGIVEIVEECQRK